MSYGPIGPELEGAVRNGSDSDADHREQVVNKLVQGPSHFSRVDAKAMLDLLKGGFSRPIETKLREEVIKRIETPIIAADLDTSLELLMSWVFQASENSQLLTYQGLIAKLDSIGSYLTTLRDSSSEWNVSIAPVKELNLSNSEREKFLLQYRQGTQARWEHIQAEADCQRPKRLKEIHQLVQSHPVTIIRGASGQGKSSLGWRYLQEYCAEGLRFHIRMVRNSSQAKKIATVLAAHVLRLNLNAVVFFDIAPSDTDWPELLADLATSGLKVLVAIREEDFRKAAISVSDFDFGEVALDHVDRNEACEIYNELTKSVSSVTLDFDEAWSAFDSSEGGPLLEFTHIISEGQTLDSRIQSQIAKIQEAVHSGKHGITASHLQLLGLSAIANEAGVTIPLDILCESTALAPLSAPTRIFEEEYLLRHLEEKERVVVDGLHPLRSAAIVRALCAGQSDLRTNLVEDVLPLISDTDIEAFLLFQFSLKPENNARLIDALQTFSPRSWSHAGGITRALLWEGVSRYEIKNRSLLEKATNEKNEGWWLCVDSFVGMEEGEFTPLQDSQDILNLTGPKVHLSPKREVFNEFIKWSAKVVPPPLPISNEDWSGAGDIAHWIGRLKISGTMANKLIGLVPDGLPPEISVESLGRFISGRASFRDAEFNNWQQQFTPALCEFFAEKTDSLLVTTDGSEVKVFFTAHLALKSGQKECEAFNWHENTISRIQLLRQIFPQCKIYASQGIGLEMMSEMLPYDPTNKAIKASSLPDPRSVFLNSLFLGIVSFRHRRPSEWKEYASAALNFRIAVLDCVRKLSRYWEKLYGERTPRQNTINKFPETEIELAKRLSNLPMLPQRAVDRLGIKSENKGSLAGKESKGSLGRFKEWRSSFSDFEDGVSFSLNNALDFTVGYLTICNTKQPSEEEHSRRCRLILSNLADALQCVETMQHQFRALFGKTISDESITDLDKHEANELRRLWMTIYPMAAYPHRHLKNAARPTAKMIEGRKKSFLQQLEKEIKFVIGDSASLSIRGKATVIEGEPHLIIVCDYPDIALIEQSLVQLPEAIWRASQFRKWNIMEWKPLEVEWPKITIVSLFEGKAIHPAWVTLSTIIFFANENDFETKLHHHTPIPVDSNIFESQGLLLWHGEILQALIKLQSRVHEFVMTFSRFNEILALFNSNETTERTSKRIQEEFSNELNEIRRKAVESHSEAESLISKSALPEKELLLAQLQQACETLLLEPKNRNSISITIDSFFDWADCLETSIHELQQIVSRIITESLALEKLNEPIQ